MEIQVAEKRGVYAHWVENPVISCKSLKYEGESNENLKYILSRNLLNTQGTQWHFST